MNIDVHELRRSIDQDDNVILIDVRSKDEHQALRISEAVLMTVEEMIEAKDELSKYERIYIHCHSGGRSQRACKILRENGLDKVINVDGGISDWKAEGFEIES